MFYLRILMFQVIIWVPSLGGATELTAADCTLLTTTYGIAFEECAHDAEGPTLRQLTAQQRSDHVFFRRGGAALDAEAMSQLDRLVAVLQTEPLRNTCLKLIGYTDSTGTPVANVRLSRERAEAVASYLQDRLRNPAQVTEVVASGSSEGLPDFPSSAPENRRVAFFARSCATASMGR